MSLLLGIDLGTSYFKIGLFDESGTLQGLGRVRVDKHSPVPGRFEVPVVEFWRILRRGLSEAMSQAGATADRIAALSYSSQANSFVLLDGSDTPLTPLVLRTDTRAKPLSKTLDHFGRTELFRRTVGSEGIAAECAGAKCGWFRENAPEVWARTRRIMTISDLFTFELTGERAGDASTAAFLKFYDLAGRDWWSEALAMFGLDREMLSAPLTPGTACGRTVRRAVELLGVPAGIPFAVGALDHHAAAIGSGLGRFADMSISTGTVLAALTLVDRPDPMPSCHHGPHVDGTRYYRLAFDPAGGGRLEDYQRRFAPGRDIEQLLALAAEAPVGRQGRIGAEGERTEAELGAEFRMLLEEIGASHRTLVRLAAGAAPGRIAATRGGARSPLLLQIDADMLNAPIVTSVCPERACLGAAAFAAAAAGWYSGAAEAAGALVKPARTYEPDLRRRGGVRQAGRQILTLYNRGRR